MTTHAQTEARAIQRYIAPSAGRGAIVQLLKHCDGEWVRYRDHATALASVMTDRDGWKRTATEYASELHSLRSQLAKTRKALEAIYTEARSLPLHTSAVTREHVLTSKLAVIRDAALRALGRKA